MQAPYPSPRPQSAAAAEASDHRPICWTCIWRTLRSWAGRASRRQTRSSCSQPATPPVSRARFLRVARERKTPMRESSVAAHVTIGRNEKGFFELAVKLEISAPDRDQSEIEEFVRIAHEQICPYSLATRGNRSEGRLISRSGRDEARFELHLCPAAARRSAKFEHATAKIIAHALTISRPSVLCVDAVECSLQKQDWLRLRSCSSRCRRTPTRFSKSGWVASRVHPPITRKPPSIGKTNGTRAASASIPTKSLALTARKRSARSSSSPISRTAKKSNARSRTAGLLRTAGCWIFRSVPRARSGVTACVASGCAAPVTNEKLADPLMCWRNSVLADRCQPSPTVTPERSVRLFWNSRSG